MPPPALRPGAPPRGACDETITAIEQALHTLARRLGQGRLHEYFTRQAGVDLDQAGLAVLYVLGEPGTCLRITDLAARLSIDTPAVTRKVQQLERHGLLSRGKDAGDARACLVRLTPRASRRSPGSWPSATGGSRPSWPAGRTRTAASSPAWWPGSPVVSRAKQASCCSAEPGPPPAHAGPPERSPEGVHEPRDTGVPRW